MVFPGFYGGLFLFIFMKPLVVSQPRREKESQEQQLAIVAKEFGLLPWMCWGVAKE